MFLQWLKFQFHFESKSHTFFKEIKITVQHKYLNMKFCAKCCKFRLFELLSNTVYNSQKWKLRYLLLKILSLMVGMGERGEVYDFMVNLVSKVTKSLMRHWVLFCRWRCRSALSIQSNVKKGSISAWKMVATILPCRDIPKNSIDSLDPSQIWRRQIQAVHRFVTTKAFKWHFSHII